MGGFRIIRKRQAVTVKFTAIVIVLLHMGLLSSCGGGSEPMGQEGNVLERPETVSEEAPDVSKDLPNAEEPASPGTVPEGESLGDSKILSEAEEVEMVPDTTDYAVGEEQRNQSEIRVYSRKRLVRRILFFYDEQGNVAAEEKFGMDKENPEYRKEYDYDEQGRLSSMCSYGEDGVLESREEYVYDEEGRLFSVCGYGNDGVLESREEYVYNERGLAIEARDYNEKTGSMFLTKYTYDNWENMLSWQRYDDDGKLHSREAYEYTYDEQGNILTMHEYRPGATGINRLHIYDYGNNGMISGEREYSLDEKALVLMEQGFVVTDVKTDSNGILLWRWEYDYDEQGNMLAKRQYRSDGELENYYEYNNIY